MYFVSRVRSRVGPHQDSVCTIDAPTPSASTHLPVVSTDNHPGLHAEPRDSASWAIEQRKRCRIEPLAQHVKRSEHHSQSL